MSVRKPRKKSPIVETVMFPFPERFGDIHLRDIEVFVALLESDCSPTKAAKKLRCGKGRITKRHDFLAEKLGGPLIDDGNLTRIGQKFREFAEQIYTTARSACDVFEKAKITVPRDITVGYLETPVTLFYTDTCQRFNEKYPTEIVPKNEWGHELIRNVDAGNFDLALLANPHPMKLPDAVKYCELVQYRCFCAIGTKKAHALANRTSISLHEMREECLLLMDKKARLYTEHINMFFSKVGGVKRKRHCPNAVTQINRIISGEGVGFVMYPFGEFVANRPIRLIPIEPAEYLGVGVVFRPPVHQVIRNFVEIARSVIRPQLKGLGKNAQQPHKDFVCQIETVQ